MTTDSGRDCSSTAAKAVESILLCNPTARSCIAYMEELFRAELQQASPDIAKLSIALGAVELPLTVKQEADQHWPEDLEQQVAAHLEAFEGFVLEMHLKVQSAGLTNSRGKVKLVADAIWSKLTGSFSKDILHAQHVYSFAALLLPGGAKGKRQLDCAGVVTTTYAVCQRLAAQHDHLDLAACGMCISEDHCWLTLDGSSPSRLSSVEVTTDTPAKRGLPASEEAWAGWLYTGGHAVLCCPRRAVAALVNSLNPAVTAGKGGRDSEQLQALQCRLLGLLWREHRAAVYPAALCSLADLQEVALQDELDGALAGGHQQLLDSLLQRSPEDPQELFEKAIAMAAGRHVLREEEAGRGDGAPQTAGEISDCSQALLPVDGAHAELAGATNGALELAGLAPAAGWEHSAGAAAVPALAELVTDGCSAAPLALASGSAGKEEQGQLGETSAGAGADPGWQWYPYSYLGGYLARRGEFLAKCAAAFPTEADLYSHMALASLRGALQCMATGAGVLAKYKFNPTDDQLYKDVEGALEYAHDGLAAALRSANGSNSSGNGSGLGDSTLLQPVLRLWDGVCQLYAGKPKPSGWVALLLKVCKLFSAEAREAAAAAEEPASEAMRKARGLWGPLKPVALRPLFESADVSQGEQRQIKRPRR